MPYLSTPALKTKSLQIRQDVLAAEAKLHARIGREETSGAPQTKSLLPGGVEEVALELPLAFSRWPA